MLSCTHVLSVLSLMKERGMMSQQQRRMQVPLAGTVFLCLFVAVFLAVWKRFSKSAASDSISRHSVGTPSGEALKYWTVDKMRHAKPTNLPNVKALKRKKKQPQSPPDTSRPQHD